MPYKIVAKLPKCLTKSENEKIATRPFQVQPKFFF